MIYASARSLIECSCSGLLYSYGSVRRTCVDDGSGFWNAWPPAACLWPRSRCGLSYAARLGALADVAGAVVFRLTRFFACAVLAKTVLLECLKSAQLC
jgi:hypothetical protein